MDSKKLEKEIRKRCKEADIPVEVLTSEELAELRSDIEAEERGIYITDGVFFNPELYERAMNYKRSGSAKPLR